MENRNHSVAVRTLIMAVGLVLGIMATLAAKGLFTTLA